MIVVDASLATKWILAEAETPAAMGFLRDHGEELFGPDLIFIEVAAAIVRRGNGNKAIIPDAVVALDKWTTAWSSHVVKRLETTQRRLFLASSLALELGHPLKDCIYLQLAIEYDCDFVTCDARFIGKAARRWSRSFMMTDYA